MSVIYACPFAIFNLSYTAYTCQADKEFIERLYCEKADYKHCRIYKKTMRKLRPDLKNKDIDALKWGKD